MIQHKLKTVRKNKGFSQGQMAKALATDASNYSRKERGEVKIYEDEWQKLSKVLDVPIDELKESERNFSFQYDNSTFHDHSGSNVNYYNIPNFIVENLQEYINLLKEEVQRLKEEIEHLKGSK